MKLDADDFRVNITIISHITLPMTQEERLKAISILSIITGVHIVIVASYLGELYGFTPELLARRQRLIDFYTISSILNVRDQECKACGVMIDFEFCNNCY